MRRRSIAAVIVFLGIVGGTAAAVRFSAPLLMQWRTQTDLFDRLEGYSSA